MRGAVLQSNVLVRALDEFVRRLVEAVPTLVVGIVFLALAAILVKLVLAVLETTLGRTMGGESPVYRQFLTTVVAVFLWFGVGLSTLSVVGLEGIAASLGTAAGFVALGVSYATSDMIADAVAGVYLLRDPDFEAGDTVRVGPRLIPENSALAVSGTQNIVQFATTYAGSLFNSGRGAGVPDTATAVFAALNALERQRTPLLSQSRDRF